MKKLLALLFLLDSSLALGQGTNSPCYWAGTLAKCWPLTGIYLDDNRSLRLGEDAANGSNYVELISPASLSGNGVLTMPAATDTLVGKATTDTLTNKTIDADGTGNSITNIENENIKASAAIAYSKLDLADDIVNADINSSAAIAYSKLNLATSIVNADVSASAAIAGSKLVAATNAVAGAVTTSAQNIAGMKTFYDGIELDDDSGQSTLNYYQTDDVTLASVNFAGSGGGGAASCAVRITRVGRMVTIDIAGTQLVTPAGGSTSIASATALPSWARPAANRAGPALVYNNGAWLSNPGWMNVDSGGTISFFRDGAGTAFTNTTNAGFLAVSFSYGL